MKLTLFLLSIANLICEFIAIDHDNQQLAFINIIIACFIVILLFT